MASWQFTCIVVPRKTWELNHPNPVTQAFESSLSWWEGMTLAQMIALLAPLGPPAADHWDKTAIVWGHASSTIVAIHPTEDSLVDEVRLRVDLRGATPHFVHALMAIMTTHGWIFISEHGDEVSPDAEHLEHAAQASDAGLFVNNPEAYLQKVQQRAERDGHDE